MQDGMYRTAPELGKRGSGQHHGLKASRAPRRMRPGFTLIELLIVVAIIAILAAIAVPNFLEAQIRSKVSRMKADSRAIALGCEAYRVDNNKYPIPGDAFLKGLTPQWEARQMRLTTPIAYLSTLPQDVFRSEHPHNKRCLFDVETREGIDPLGTSWFAQDPKYPLIPVPLEVYIRSWGPDQDQSLPNMKTSERRVPAIPKDTMGWSYEYHVYDPTNGTVSNGDIWSLLPGPALYPK